MTGNAAQTLGSALRAARESTGRTRFSVAVQAGISTTYLRRLEGDSVRAPSPHVLRRLAGALGLGYVDLCRAVSYLTPEDEESIKAKRSQADVEASRSGGDVP